MMQNTFEGQQQQQPAWATGVQNSNVMMGEINATDVNAEYQDPGSATNNILLQPVSTLDEPVIDTIMRDVKSVYAKLKVVLLPLDRSTPFGYAGVSQDNDNQQQQMGENQQLVLNSLKEWDLWGPLLVCLSLSVVLALRAPQAQISQVFAAVFLSVWVGSTVVTINAQLLGGSISFFQSLCVLGYCVFPMLVAAALVLLEDLVMLPKFLQWINFVWIGIAFVWATRASVVFIGQYIVPERRTLAVFPVFFFYTFLGWLILLF